MVASAEFDPVVVEAQLTLQKLGQLLLLKRESAKLDYKETLTPTERRDVVEISKDLVAMANTAGGYIVLGVMDNGECAGLERAAREEFDEATIRAQVQSFIGVPLELFLDKTMEWEGKDLAVITVLRSPRSPIVFQKDGQSPDPKGRKPSTTAFRQGDVFVRHGSASERWNQDDVRTIYARVVEREKERWLAEVMPDVRRLIVGAATGQLPQVDPASFLQSDAETFDRALRELIRRLS